MTEVEREDATYCMITPTVLSAVSTTNNGSSQRHHIGIDNQLALLCEGGIVGVMIKTARYFKAIDHEGTG